MYHSIIPSEERTLTLHTPATFEEMLTLTWSQIVPDDNCSNNCNNNSNNNSDITTINNNNKIYNFSLI